MVSYERKVQYYETDRMDCVHHSNYIRWFEEARANLMQLGGFPYEGMEQGGVLSPVTKVEVDYRSMCRYGETVLIETEIAGYTGTRIEFTYVVRDRESGQVRCTGKTGHCFLKAGRPVALQKVLPSYHEKVKAACTTHLA